MSNFYKLIVGTFLFVQSMGCGTLGGLKDRVFHVSKQKVENAIDSFYSVNPEYSVPEKWERYNTWSKRGYDFLDGRIFYFKSFPEEMYYVSFVGAYTSPADTFECTIAIRSVFKEDAKGWYLEKDLDAKEQKRIETRFDDEIVSKIEVYTETKSRRE